MHKATCADCRRNVKFHSSQTVVDQFIAESATPNEDHREDIKLIS